MPTISPPPQVLVVDDDEGLSFLVSESLREIDIEATPIPSGMQALESLKIRQPDLMLLDLKLNDLSGQALLKRLNEEGISVPFIVVTGEGNEQVAVEMMKQGALDYVIKDTGMLDRLPLVVKRAAERLEKDRALASVRAALLESEKQVLAVSERERHRIGVDLHDNLGQQLTAIEILCYSLREDLHSHPAMETRMRQICRFLQEAVAQTRQLARGLIPVSLGSRGLADCLAEMVSRMSHGSVQCEFVCPVPVEIEDDPAANHLFHIAQEAVNNARKHARARKVSVTLSRSGDNLVLRIDDNGRGFPKSKKAPSGLGLEIMRHRANVIGATLETQSGPGTHITVTWPISRPA